MRKIISLVVIVTNFFSVSAFASEELYCNYVRKCSALYARIATLNVELMENGSSSPASKLEELAKKTVQFKAICNMDYADLLSRLSEEKCKELQQKCGSS